MNVEVSSSPGRAWMGLLGGLLGLLPVVSGCAPAERAEVVPEIVAEQEEDVELAVLMGAMQRHSAKLGYALEGRNRRLAAFYLAELGEVMEEVESIEAHDGMPIGHPTATILGPLMPPLDDALQQPDWPTAWTAYEQLIDGCNRCHFATEHDFIAIVPATGEAPYNQRFTPLGAASAEASP